jgi:hypothetical protein
VNVFTGLEQGEQRRQLGRAHARACVCETKLPDEHGGAKVNGLVRLELRGVATGVSAAAWQLACEGVRAREHARAPLGQEEQGSTPAGAGVCEQNVGGEGLSSHEVGAQKGELHGGTPGCSPACVRVDEHEH